MQKIYIIKHKYYHSHGKEKEKMFQHETIVPLLHPPYDSTKLTIQSASHK